jgi:hypothetical protein
LPHTTRRPSSRPLRDPLRPFASLSPPSARIDRSGHCHPRPYAPTVRVIVTPVRTHRPFASWASLSVRDVRRPVIAVRFTVRPQRGYRVDRGDRGGHGGGSEGVYEEQNTKGRLSKEQREIAKR